MISQSKTSDFGSVFFFVLTADVDRSFPDRHFVWLEDRIKDNLSPSQTKSGTVLRLRIRVKKLKQPNELEIIYFKNSFKYIWWCRIFLLSLVYEISRRK